MLPNHRKQLTSAISSIENIFKEKTDDAEIDKLISIAYHSLNAIRQYVAHKNHKDETKKQESKTAYLNHLIAIEKNTRDILR